MDDKEKKLTPEQQAAEDAKNDDRQLIYKIKLLESASKTQRRKFDWQWLVRALYVRGYHFAQYNRGTNTIVFSTRTGVKIPINLVMAHLRAVRNQVTSFKPKWEVLPNVTTDDAEQNTRYSGKVLDYLYEKAQIKRKIKEVVTDSLMFSIGIWMFDVDSKGNVSISRVDPFDFLVDPNVKSPNLSDPDYGAEYVIYSTQTSIDWVKHNKDFQNTDQVRTDNQVASAEYKRFLLQVTRNVFSTQKEANPTVILKQAFLRERQDNGDIKIRIITYVDGMDRPLKNELTDSDEYPFEILQGDIQPGELYGEGWIKHLIPINRVIDALESHIFEYNHFFARGKWIIDKNSGVRLLVNQHGQIVEKNRGSTVTPVTVPPLPPSPMDQIGNMRKYLEDLSGAHDVSLGRMPGTIRSGVAIAELRQADSTNQSDLVDNLEDFLARSGRRILKLVAENWDTTRLIAATGLGGKPEYFMAVGANSAKRFKDKKDFTMGDKKLPLAIIGAENEVRVQVGSWLAYTKEARQEKLKELFRLGAIDQKSYLQHAEFADIDGIIDRTKEERILQAAAGSRSESVQKAYGITLDDEALAMAENELMDENVEQHAEPGDDHQVHIMVHKEDAENPLVKAHIAEHMNYEKWEMKMKTSIPKATGPAGNVPAPVPGAPGMPPGPGGAPGGGPNFVPSSVGPGMVRPFNEAQPTLLGGPMGPGLQPIVGQPG